MEMKQPPHVVGQVVNHKQRQQLKQFLMAQTLAHGSAAQHQGWVKKNCIPGVKRGTHLAYAWWRNGDMVADIILRASACDTMRIANLYVVELERRNRVGAYFVDRACLEAGNFLNSQKKLSNKLVTVEAIVPAECEAVRFFRRLEFGVCGTEARYQAARPDNIMQKVVQL